MPRGVLWTALPKGSDSVQSATDPLTLALSMRSQWATGKNLPENATSDQMCTLIDQGFVAEASQATSEQNGGRVRLQRIGAKWTVSEAVAPTAAIDGTCG